MATRGVSFFMRSAEFWSAIWEAAAKYNLVVIVERYLRERKRYRLDVASDPSALVAGGETPFHRVDLATERPDFDEADDLHPGKWGWVTADVPREVGNILFLAQMGAKSDWWDSERQQVVDNPASLEVFGKVSRVFRKRLKRPVWAFDIFYSKEPGRTRDIWYSEGAAEWVRRDGQLRQVGASIFRPAAPLFQITKPSDVIRERLFSYRLTVRPYTGGKRVDEWIKGKSFADRVELGDDLWRAFSREDAGRSVDATGPLEVVKRYLEAMERASDANPDIAACWARELHDCYVRLRASLGGRMAIVALTSSPNPRVQVWAAAHSLAWAPEVARQALEQVRLKDLPEAVDAKWTLKEFDRGSLSFA